MSDKIKIVLGKQKKYIIQHLLRNYKQALELTNSGQSLFFHDVFSILDKMGYLREQKSDKEYELVKTLVKMLQYPISSGKLSQRNLFAYLLVINQINANCDDYFSQVPSLYMQSSRDEQPLVKISLGSFTPQGKWCISKEQQKQLLTLFGEMILTRKSRKNIPSNSNTKQTTNISLSPKINKYSEFLVSSRRKTCNYSSSVYERLYQLSSHKDKIQQFYNDELANCTFRPKINTSRHKRVNSLPQNYGSYLNALGREDNRRKLIKQQEYEEYQKQRNIKQCSFSPNIIRSFNHRDYSPSSTLKLVVKNSQKSIERMGKARIERQGILQVQKRGYPNVQSWIKFLQNVRQSRFDRNENDNNRKTTQSRILLTITLKILGKQKYLQVKQGDILLKLAERLIKKDRISERQVAKISRVIQDSLLKSGQVIINDGIISKKERS